MPLIILSGQPSSGKSFVASRLAEKFRALGLEVTVVDEPGLHLNRNTSYTTTFNEKNTRALLKSTVERSVSKHAVVILDSLNNIKGYRYELWCIARAAATRYCVVHVATPTDVCRTWNAARLAENAYSPEVFEDLAGRFETPDSRNRWDSPLFTVLPGASEPLPTIDPPPTYPPPTSDPSTSDPPTGEPPLPLGGEEADPLAPEAPASEAAVLDAVVAEMTRQEDPNPNAQRARTLQPTMATSNAALASTDTLAEMDAAVQDVVNRVVAAQGSSGSDAPGAVHFGEDLPVLHLERAVGLAELRRHKRSFLKLATKITFSRIQASTTAKRMFVDYLRDNVGGVHR